MTNKEREMNIQDYLQWFEDNYQTMARFSEDPLRFSLRCDISDGVKWTAGYNRFVDYEGFWFFKGIQGQGESPLVVLADSQRKTLPVVNKLQLAGKLRNAVLFHEGETYTRIQLGTTGDVDLAEMIGKSRAVFGFQFESVTTGDTLFCSPYQYKLIFPRLSPEMKAQLEGSD